MSAIVPAQTNRNIVSAICFAVDKLDLSSRVNKVALIVNFMPFRQGRGKLLCYEKVHYNINTSYPNGFYEGESEKFEESLCKHFAEYFQVSDKMGDVFHEIHFKAEVESFKLINGEEMKLTTTVQGSCKGSFKGESRLQLFGKSKEHDSLLIEGLDITPPPGPLDDDERRRFLLMP